VDAGHGAIVHGRLDFFLWSAEGVVDHRLVFVVATLTLGFLHAKDLGADLGTGFATDAGILIDNRYAGHDAFLSFWDMTAIEMIEYGFLYYLGSIISRKFSPFRTVFFASPAADSVLFSGLVWNFIFFSPQSLYK
jgi:hypothetical protein